MIKNRIRKLIENRSCNQSKAFNKYNMIGEGQYGKVYKACIKNNKSCVAVKNATENLKTEYTIAKELSHYNIPAVYGHIDCSMRHFLFSEYVDGMSLRKYMKETGGRDLKKIMRQVIVILKKIHSAIPSFRHHDLHLDNIMVTPGLKVKIMDFGLSTMEGVVNKTISPPMFKNDFGIFPMSHHMYDVHLFLNDIYQDRHTSNPIKTFIKRVLPDSYLKKESPDVSNFRLRYNRDHSSLPTFDQLLKDPLFISDYLETILKKTTTSSVTVNKKPNTPQQNRAKAAAMAFLAKQKETPGKKKQPSLRRPTLKKSAPKPLSINKNKGNSIR